MSLVNDIFQPITRSGPVTCIAKLGVLKIDDTHTHTHTHVGFRYTRCLSGSVHLPKQDRVTLQHTHTHTHIQTDPPLLGRKCVHTHC